MKSPEVFEKGLFDLSINNGRLALLAAAARSGDEPEDDVDDEAISLWPGLLMPDGDFFP